MYSRAKKPVETDKARQKRGDQRRRQAAKRKEIQHKVDEEAGIVRPAYVVPPPKPEGAKRARRGKRGQREQVHLPDLDHEASLRRTKAQTQDLPVDEDAIPMAMHSGKDVTANTVMCVRCLEVR